MFVQRSTYFFLITWIASLYEHGNHHCYEAQAVLAQLSYESTPFKQFSMTMGIWGIIVASCSPIGLYDFFQCLMAKKCSIKPIAVIVRKFCNLHVLFYNVQPFLYDIFSCHNILI